MATAESLNLTPRFLDSRPSRKRVSIVMPHCFGVRDGQAVVDAAAVAALLEKSHAAHWRYHQNIPHKVVMPGGMLSTSGGDDGIAQSALSDAATFRQRAHDLDPDHTAGAWRDEAARFPHTELTTFYAQQLADRNGH